MAGVTINIRMKGSGSQQIQYLQQLKRRLGDRRDGLNEATNRVAKVWNENFESEGRMVGGWKDLADATIRRRDYYGYKPWPILVRYGALQSVAVEGFMSARGDSRWSSRDNYSGHDTRASLKLSKGVATLEAHGWKVANQWGHPNRRGSPVPARPFWFINRNVQRAARDGVVHWIVNEVI